MLTVIVILGIFDRPKYFDDPLLLVPGDILLQSLGHRSLLAPVAANAHGLL